MGYSLRQSCWFRRKCESSFASRGKGCIGYHWFWTGVSGTLCLWESAVKGTGLRTSLCIWWRGETEPGRMGRWQILDQGWNQRKHRQGCLHSEFRKRIPEVCRSLRKFPTDFFSNQSPTDFTDLHRFFVLQISVTIVTSVGDFFMYYFNIVWLWQTIRFVISSF